MDVSQFFAHFDDSPLLIKGCDVDVVASSSGGEVMSVDVRNAFQQQTPPAQAAANPQEVELTEKQATPTEAGEVLTPTSPAEASIEDKKEDEEEVAQTVPESSTVVAVEASPPKEAEVVPTSIVSSPTEEEHKDDDPVISYRDQLRNH